MRFLLAFLVGVAIYADTPPPGAVKAKAYNGAGTQAIGNVSDALKVNFSNTTLAITAASLPIPLGAATAAKQPALGTAGSASSDVLTVQGVTSMTPLKVDASVATVPVSGTFFQATQPVSLASLPALAVGSNVIGGVTQSGTWTVQPGNTANTTAWLVTQNGRAKANVPVRYDYSGGSVTTSAYTQILASSTSAANYICVFDSSGQDLVLAVGAAASEVDQIGIFPGGNGCEPLQIAASSRISIKAKSATASTGVLLLNLYQ